MKNKSDKETFKFRKNNKKRKKEKDSNSSRDSLELTIKSYQENSKINHKDIGNGENIKFLFNEFPVNKNKTNKNQKLNSNEKEKEKEEFDFSKLLLNYVNQTGRTKEKKSNKNEMGSIIYTKKNEVLTLNGENNDSNNNDEFSNRISKLSISETNSKKTEKEKIKKIKEKKNNENKIKNFFNTKTLINKKANLKNNQDKLNQVKQVMILSDKKMKNSEKNVESVINSNYNKLTNSNKIIVSNKNTFTTATNTQDSSNMISKRKIMII